YRMNRERGKVMEAVDLATGEYRTQQKVEVPADLAKSLKALMSSGDKLGAYTWRVLSAVLSYAASVAPEIADDVVSVDDAMKLGFSWKFGPFELIDNVGADWLAERLAAEGRPVPALLKAAAGKTFYRVDGGKRQFLG